ncbi:MAG: deoxyribonuclease IV [Candidatus Dependentiae bacterium]|nr:deoxyribonuclease IV [Candidatus Dependentiae bacterium]
MRTIGLHLRLINSLTEVAEKALAMQLPLFQSFLVQQGSGALIHIEQEDIKKYLKIRQEKFKDLYVHGSYWINLAGVKYTKHYALDRELALAKKLEFTHLVLHPGSAKGAKTRREGIDAMARIINATMAKEHSIKIVLENTAYGSWSIGGDVHDFQILLTMLDHPEKILFCIDTAHAHSFGYDIIDATAREEFIQLLDATIGIERIALLHLNDTQEKRGSKKDRHEVIGKGVLGDEVLKSFVLHDRLKNIPLLMELPIMEQEQEQMMVDKIKQWHTE